MPSSLHSIIVSCFLVITMISSPVQGAEQEIKAQTSVLLPDGESIEWVEFVEKIEGESMPYSAAGVVSYTQINFRRKSGNEVLYKGPSAPGRVEPSSDSTALPIVAMCSDVKAEVCRISGGYFELFRFSKENDNWRFHGHQEHSDFDVGLSSKEPPPQHTSNKIQYLDWGTFRATMLEGSVRQIVVEADGSVSENRKPFVYLRRSNSPANSSEFERDRVRYQDSAKFYYEPRDVNGVPLILHVGMKKLKEKNATKEVNVVGSVPLGGPVKSETVSIDSGGSNVSGAQSRSRGGVMLALIAVVLILIGLWHLSSRCRR